MPHNNIVHRSRGADAHTTKSKGGWCGDFAPCADVVFIGGKGVFAFALCTNDFYLYNRFVPRQVLSHFEAHSRERMAEGEVGAWCRGTHRTNIGVHITRAGRHQILLIPHIGFYLEIYVGRACVACGRKFQLVIVGLRVNRIEASVVLQPIPVGGSNKVAILLRVLVVEPRLETCVRRTIESCGREVLHCGQGCDVGTGRRAVFPL